MREKNRTARESIAIKWILAQNKGWKDKRRLIEVILYEKQYLKRILATKTLGRLVYEMVRASRILMTCKDSCLKEKTI